MIRRVLDAFDDGPLTMLDLREQRRELVKAWPGVSIGTPGAETWESSQNWLRGWGTHTGHGMTAPYAQHATIALGLSTISHDAATIPWEVWGADEDHEEGKALDTHPVLDILARPSTRMSGFQLWVGTYLSRMLFGEAFWYYPNLRVRQRTGIKALDRREDQIVLLDPRCVRHTILPNGTVVWTLYAFGVERLLPPDRFTQFKRFNPYDPVRGLSLIEAVLRDAGADYSAAAWNERFFSEQNGIPTGLLIPSAVAPALNPDQREDYLRRFRERHEGQRRVGIVPPGWDWKDIGINQRDMDFTELRKYSREQVLAMIGLPPFYAGVLENANYANAREQKEVYWLGTIKRNVTETQDTLNNDFLPKIGLGDQIELWPCWEEVNQLTENYGEKLDSAAKLFNLGVPLSVINDRLQLGLDTTKIPTADVAFLPFSVTPAEHAAEPPEPVAVPFGDEQDEDAPQGENGNGEYRTHRKALPAERERRRAMLWRNLIVRTRDLEDRFTKVMRSHYRELGQDVIDQLNGVKGMALVGKTENIGLIVIGGDEADRRLQEKTKGLHKSALSRGGGSLIADMGLGVDFDINSPMAIAKLSQLTGRIVNVNQTIERALRDSLAEGVNAGESVGQLADRVRSVVSEASRSRAATIARTEVGGAFSGGRHSAMVQVGVKWQEWLTSRDGSVRESHVALDGDVIALGESFSNGLRYPQDPSGPPDETINCRCVLLPVVRAEN